MPSRYDPGSLERDVRALATPAGRSAGTGGHARAREVLNQRLEQIGLEPYGHESFELPYRERRMEFVNVVGIAPGSDRSSPPVLVGAHYDTAGPYPGADDNAAAVAIALAVAERLRSEPAERDVVIALFDAEEPPYFQTSAMGSIRFRTDQQQGPVHAALIMDLVGHEVPLPGCEGVVFVTGMESDPGLERTIRARPDVEGIDVVTAHNRYVGDMSDHHAYRLGRTPYLFLTCGRWEHYHRPTDTPEKLAYPKMAGVAAFLEHLVRDTSTRELEGPWEGYDTTATDLRTMRAALGPVADRLGVPLASRSDIERLAHLLMARFGL